MGWTTDDLHAAIGRYEEELIAAGLQPISVHSFVTYSRRFIRWRTGEYRPRTASGPARSPSRGKAGVADLEIDLVDYDGELRNARLQPLAVQTYVDQARRFVRWLDGGYTPRDHTTRSR